MILELAIHQCPNLQKFKIDCLKIDQSFPTNCENSFPRLPFSRPEFGS
jgi:EAL domain-containing protein (putative c-di-GMP-specific phosphodiesterase class I)